MVVTSSVSNRWQITNENANSQANKTLTLKTLTFRDQWLWGYKKAWNKNQTRSVGRLLECYKNIKPRWVKFLKELLSHMWLLGKMVCLSPLKVLIFIFKVWKCLFLQVWRKCPSLWYFSSSARPAFRFWAGQFMFNLNLIFWAVSEIKSSRVVSGLSNLTRSLSVCPCLIFFCTFLFLPSTFSSSVWRW